VPPHFDGVLLRPDPPVSRALSAYTRAKPDPVTAAFIAVAAKETVVLPPYILHRIGPAAPAS